MADLNNYWSYLHNSSDVILLGNCSYYLIPYGSFEFTESSNTSTNVTYSKLPGLYITNCTLDTALYQEVTNTLLSHNVLGYTTDSFNNGMLSLSFVLSGVTVSSWMLMVLSRLSPHRKPMWVELTTLFYTAGLTTLLSKTTSLLDRQYHEDMLDVFKFKHDISCTVAFKTILMVFQSLIYISWTQIALHIMKHRYKKKIIFLSSLFSVLSIMTWAIYIFYKDSQDYPGKLVLKIFKYFFQLLVAFSFSLGIIYITLKKRRYSYQRRILPLAFCTIMVLLVHPLFAILEASSMLFGTWCLLLRTLSDVASCVMVWEWIADTEELEKRTEVIGVLGRKVSDEDILGYEDRIGRDNQDNKSKGTLLSRIKRAFMLDKSVQEKQDIVSLYELVDAEVNSFNTDEVSEYRESINSSDAMGGGMGEGLSNVDDFHNGEEDIEMVELEYSDDDADSGNRDNGNTDDDAINQSQGQSTSYGNNSHSVPNGVSDNRDDILPPFEVHPGFQTGDYWDDKNVHGEEEP